MRRELMVTTLWFIWSERNIIREEGRRRPAEAIARSIELFFNENVQSSIKSTQQATTSIQRWTRPPVDILKLNADGSFLADEKGGSWGFLIRDSDGDVVISGRGRIEHLLSALQAELMACIMGLQTAVDLGIGKMILETDAQEVVRALKTSSYDKTTVGHLATEIKFLVQANFISFDCVHVSRDCNKAAHELAKLGRACAVGEESLTVSLPDAINVIVANDLLASD